MNDSSRHAVPKPIHRFQKRPRGGAGPRLQIDPQTSMTATATIPVLNIPNITTSTSLDGITPEQVAAIANIVMAVQNQTIPIPPKPRKMNTSGTIKEQKSRLEKNPRRTVLLVRTRFLLNMKNT
jgi:hypothetical protein